MSSFALPHLSKKKSFSHIIMFWTGVCLQCLHPSLLWSNSSHTARGGEQISYNSACVLYHSVRLYIWCKESKFSLLVSLLETGVDQLGAFMPYFSCHCALLLWLLALFSPPFLKNVSVLNGTRGNNNYKIPLELVFVSELLFFFLGTLLAQRFSKKKTIVQHQCSHPPCVASVMGCERWYVLVCMQGLWPD